MTDVNQGYLLGLCAGTGLSALGWAGSQFLDTPAVLAWVMPGSAALSFALAMRLQARRTARKRG